MNPLQDVYPHLDLCRYVGRVQCEFPVAFVGVGVADVDPATVNLDRDHEDGSGAHRVAIEVAVGAMLFELLLGHGELVRGPQEE